MFHLMLYFLPGFLTWETFEKTERWERFQELSLDINESPL